MSTGLEVTGLNKAFGGLVVARDINLSLAPGDRKALIGPNGAGKSTFTNLITGILRPSSGTIRLDGRDIGGLSEAKRVKAGIAKTFQITNLFRSLTVRDNLRLHRLRHAAERHQPAATPLPEGVGERVCCHHWRRSLGRNAGRGNGSTQGDA